MSDIDTIIPITLVGEASVGKTCLINRFINQTFEELTTPTLGVDMFKKQVFLQDMRLLVRISDTAGQEKFRSLTDDYFKNAKGMILVYDVTQKSTFLALDSWFEKIQEKCIKDVKILLIGNKTDLKSERQVSTEEGINYAKRKGLFFIEASAKTNDGDKVNEGFNMIIAEIGRDEIENENKTIRNTLVSEKMPVIIVPKKKNCC